MPDWDKLIANAPSAGDMPQEESGGGLWGAFENFYDNVLDYNWMPDREDEEGKKSGLGKVAKWVSDRGFTGTGKAIDTFDKVNYETAKAMVGSPIRAVSTTSIPFTAGTSALAAKAPSLVRAARGIDALAALRSGGNAIEEIKEGNYGNAALEAGFAGLAGLGAVSNPLAQGAGKVNDVPMFSRAPVDAKPMMVPKPQPKVSQELAQGGKIGDSVIDEMTINPPPVDMAGPKDKASLDAMIHSVSPPDMPLNRVYAPQDERIIRDNMPDVANKLDIPEGGMTVNNPNELKDVLPPLVDRPKAGTVPFTQITDEELNIAESLSKPWQLDWSGDVAKFKEAYKEQVGFELYRRGFDVYSDVGRNSKLRPEVDKLLDKLDPLKVEPPGYDFNKIERAPRAEWDELADIKADWETGYKVNPDAITGSEIAAGIEDDIYKLHKPVETPDLDIPDARKAQLDSIFAQAKEQNPDSPLDEYLKMITPEGQVPDWPEYFYGSRLAGVEPALPKIPDIKRASQSSYQGPDFINSLNTEKGTNITRIMGVVSRARQLADEIPDPALKNQKAVEYLVENLNLHDLEQLAKSNPKNATNAAALDLARRNQTVQELGPEVADYIDDTKRALSAGEIDADEYYRRLSQDNLEKMSGEIKTSKQLKAINDATKSAEDAIKNAHQQFRDALTSRRDNFLKGIDEQYGLKPKAGSVPDPMVPLTNVEPTLPIQDVNPPGWGSVNKTPGNTLPTQAGGAGGNVPPTPPTTQMMPSGQYYPKLVPELQDASPDDAFKYWVNSREAAQLHGQAVGRQMRKFDGISFIDYQKNPDVAPELKQYFANRLDELRKSGIKLGERENYLPQIWENADAMPADLRKKLGLKPGFSFERMVESYEDGIKAGLEPRFKNLGELAHFYEAQASKAIADRQFFMYLRENKLLKPKGSKGTAGWKGIDIDAFPTARLGKDKPTTWVISPNFRAGKTLVTGTERTGAEAINNYLNPGNKLGERVANISSGMKNVVLSGGIPYTGANMHGVNTLYRWFASADNKAKDLATGIAYIARPKMARQYLESVLDNLSDARQAGLTIAAEDFDPYKFIDPVKLNESKSVFQKMENQLDKMFGDPLFRNIIPAFKMQRYTSLASQYTEGLTNATEIARAKNRAAQEVNAMFGGINWKELGESRNLQNFLRTAILAPDWARTTTQLGKRIANDPRNELYQKFIVNTTGALMGVNLLNKQLTGKWSFENDPGHEFEVALGKDSKGRIIYFAPFGTGADFARLPAQAARAIFNLEPSRIGEMIKNRTSIPVSQMYDWNAGNYKGDTLFTTAYNQPKNGKQILQGLLEDFVDTAVPGVVQGPVDYGLGNVSIPNALARTVEAPFKFAKPREKDNNMTVGPPKM